MANTFRPGTEGVPMQPNKSRFNLKAWACTVCGSINKPSQAQCVHCTQMPPAPESTRQAQAADDEYGPLNAE